MEKTTKHNYAVPRQQQEIDLTDQSVGRAATQIATWLMGKHKADYSAQTDCGDSVVAKHADKLRFTGKKLEQKKYYRHSNYPGGLKQTPMSKVFDQDPAEVVRKAVFNMLPKNRLRNEMMKRLRFE